MACRWCRKAATRACAAAPRRTIPAVRALDTDNDPITVEAGCILQAVQEAAAAANRLFPLSLAAEGSCTIGGNLATNAGGNGVLQFGMMREQCLGQRGVGVGGVHAGNLLGLRMDCSASRPSGAHARPHTGPTPPRCARHAHPRQRACISLGRPCENGAHAGRPALQLFLRWY